MTKKHFAEGDLGFNQKLFFRFFFNLIEGLQIKEKTFIDNKEKYSLVLVQTLHFL